MSDQPSFLYERGAPVAHLIDGDPYAEFVALCENWFADDAVLTLVEALPAGVELCDFCGLLAEDAGG